MCVLDTGKLTPLLDFLVLMYAMFFFDHSTFAPMTLQLFEFGIRASFFQPFLPGYLIL
jgi:hypothetical protein